ncbi:MAG: UDP-N-acetylmuramoyl-tripeptide--D-alanyl-D-alanine ligase [Armatimonadetes bacterium]|nr:UDP-N-acetylmuramoyl-tripeptide--D-alanyl-D-alanine ligase [Armatimonadota bacterium]
MLRLTLQDVLDHTGGRLLAGDAAMPVTGTATDSRAVRKGDLFFALKGERADGHDYLTQAFERGAAAAVVAREVLCPPGKGLVLAGDPLKALGDLAAGYRQRFPAQVVGITGSVGKTSAKEMAIAVLGACFSVLKSEGNLNTEIGLPSTLFRLEAAHRIAVLEMGMRGPGEIARLCEIARPSVGAITNIGISHIERLGSREAIARAKAEILESLPPDGVAVLNVDDPFLGFLKSRFSGKAFTFGLSPAADVRAEAIETVTHREGKPGLRFDLITPTGRTEAFLPALGRYHIANALLACAVGISFEMPPEAVAEGLAAFRNAPMRMEPVSLKRGGLLLNDAYNASPASMQAALDTLAETPGSPRIAVLGDMLELGPESEGAHRQVGEMVARAALGWLITVGERAKAIAKGAAASGMGRDTIFVCETHSEAALIVREKNTGQAVILLKGSRGMEMERVAEILDGQ